MDTILDELFCVTMEVRFWRGEEFQAANIENVLHTVAENKKKSFSFSYSQSQQTVARVAMNL